jgi:hypothetical protein
MKLFRCSVVFGALVFFPAGATVASAQEEEQEQKISCSSVPSAVRAAFAKSYPKATITSCATEPEKDKPAFEITSTEGKTGRDVLFYPDGRLIVVEETIDFNDVPEAVQKRVRQKYPRDAVTLSEKVMRDATVLYEFHVTYKGKPDQVVYDPSGNEVKQ